MPSQERCETCQKEKCLDWNKSGEHLGCGLKQGACCGGHVMPQLEEKKCECGKEMCPFWGTKHINDEALMQDYCHGHPADQERKEWWEEGMREYVREILNMQKSQPREGEIYHDDRIDLMMENIREIVIKAREEEVDCPGSIVCSKSPSDGKPLFNPPTPRKLHYLHGHQKSAEDCKSCVDSSYFKGKKSEKIVQFIIYFTAAIIFIILMKSIYSAINMRGSYLPIIDKSPASVTTSTSR